ncbi:NADPH-dependent FMN reductase [Paenirhodobacter populi]|uniref:NADPH-dependent oxidoreductase n=1 Tax=Paenirhodobacter populi TaxID=2306993 RepID=A0A443JVN8_9RHOB|nr:NAD(P)H-dependent oxidoreductase [Sinirhodobacter populi]RWR24573.1 NADPH-dependent oxidoreductase [Sinirhodobacter populi]
MTDPLKIAIIISSTRDTRLADKPAQWFADFAATERPDLTFEVLDLRDFDLPFFNETASNAWVPSQSPEAVAWQKKIAEFDGYIFVTAEYNHSIPGALKNALDQAYVEWAHKPMGAVGYGGVGAARAIEHLRLIAVELQMVPVRNAVHIGGGDFMAISPLGQNGEMSEIASHLEGSAKALLEDIAWWGRATKAARA